MRNKKVSRSWLLLASALGLMVISAGLSFGQTQTTGTISGTITDATGAVIPGAKIILTNKATGQSQTTTTNSAGYYIFPNLPAGTYDVSAEKESFQSNDRFHLTKMNRNVMTEVLARITDYVERESGYPSHFVEYVGGTGKMRYEVEHVWAAKPERHLDEFPHETDFYEYRNRIGGLLLLPKSFNASYGALPYQEKLEHYNNQNLLARTLHPQCYERNPGFVAFVERQNFRRRAARVFLYLWTIPDCKPPYFRRYG